MSHAGGGPFPDGVYTVEVDADSASRTFTCELPRSAERVCQGTANGDPSSSVGQVESGGLLLIVDTMPSFLRVRVSRDGQVLADEQWTPEPHPAGNDDCSKDCWRWDTTMEF